jgi:16S rRNA (guanine(1405)-N(7))-methyltransferase
MTELEAIIASVRSSRKYRSICQDTIGRIAARELARRSSVKEATKATKRRLHQVYGAFEEHVDYDVVFEKLESAYGAGTDADIKTACRQVLVMHSSTRERVPILDRFYGEIYQITGRPDSILDLGCGLNPLALPWMDLAPGSSYCALDIDAERIRFLDRYLRLAGLQSQARCQDILVQPPDDEAGLALLLKMSPSLERQEDGGTLRVLEQLNTRRVVVSFALRSLGGRERGMPDQYARQFLQLAENQDWRVKKLVFENELVFLIQK